MGLDCEAAEALCTDYLPASVVRSTLSPIGGEVMVEGLQAEGSGSPGPDEPRRGATWPFVVALCVMLILAGPAFAASFAAAVGGLSAVQGAMMEGGAFMYESLIRLQS